MAAHFHKLYRVGSAYNRSMNPAVFFILMMTACLSHAEDIPDTSTSTTPTVYKRWFDSFVDMRDKTSTHYMSMVHSLDQYFSGEAIEDSDNDSYVKLNIEQTFYKGGENSDGIGISARVELPNTEKHLHLIFSSDPEENKTLDQKITGNARGQRIEKENSIAGLEYVPEKTQNDWQSRYSAGVKLRVSPVPFARYVLSHKWQLNDVWQSEFKQSFWDYSDDGIGATSKLNFGRPLTDKDYFNAETVADYRDKDNKYYYAETFSNTHRLTETSAARYWFALLGESQPTSEVTNYVIGLQYRKTLYKDWLLLSINPQLEFPRAENWEATPSLTFNLQVYFNE